MNWYYADGGQQKGPVSDMDFIVLTRDGIIKGETLVWREGLPEWQPLSQVRPDLVQGASGAPVLAGMAIPEQSKDLLVQQMREGALPTTFGTANPYSLRYAGFWIRVAAKLIDVILLTVVNLTTISLLFGATYWADPAQLDPAARNAYIAVQFAAIAINLSVQIAFNTFMIWKWGGTVGKLALGLRVLRADGLSLNFGRALGRAFADILNSFACGLTYLMPAFDNPQKRGLHDHICATRVVYK